MDPLLIGSLTIILAFMAFVVWKIITLNRDESDAQNRVQAILEQENRPQRRAPPVVAGGRRAARQRRGGGREGRAPDDSDEEVAPAMGGGVARPELDRFGDDYSGEDDELRAEDGGKIGKKKAMKLQMKAEKRMQREYEIQEREERKKREQEREERLRKEQEKEKAIEDAILEKERLEREEKERREEEAYLAMKAEFAVEEEGFDENETLDSQNLLQDFIDYVKRMKAVNMDDLAAHFKLKTGDVVERIKSLVADGTLTGVIDDRGKFIYIKQEELEAVAKFINQSGRVSIQEIAEYSNKLIKLEPEVAPEVAVS